MKSKMYVNIKAQTAKEYVAESVAHAKGSYGLSGSGVKLQAMVSPKCPPAILGELAAQGVEKVTKLKFNYTPSAFWLLPEESNGHDPEGTQ